MYNENVTDALSANKPRHTALSVRDKGLGIIPQSAWPIWSAIQAGFSPAVSIKQA